jgi:GntR family transcriptional regulator
MTDVDTGICVIFRGPWVFAPNHGQPHRGRYWPGAEGRMGLVVLLVRGELAGRGPVRHRLSPGVLNLINNGTHLPAAVANWQASYVYWVTVDHDGKMPVYLQLADILRAQIAAGLYAPGRAIPSETRLMQEHGLARETVRKAVRVLAAEGLVEVVRGRGVYVNDQPS